MKNHLKHNARELTNSSEPVSQEETTSEQNTTNTSPTWETTPRKGEITVDDKNRYLSEIVANLGLSKAADQIVAAISPKIEPISSGGILLVDDLSCTANVAYDDIWRKSFLLLKLTDDMAQKCQDFIQPVIKETMPDTKGMSTLLSLPTMAVAAGVAEGLKAVGDIIGYFRSDYDIKGQISTNVDDLYVQALVAGKLPSKVYLLNFDFIKQSVLLHYLNLLNRKKNEMLIAVEEIESQFDDGKEAQIKALETHLENLRTKWVDYLVKTDDQIITTLREEIKAATDELHQLQKERVPDSQITALENYLASLRAKLVEELVKDATSALTKIETEITNLTAQLDSETTTLTKGQKKLFQDQLTLLNGQKVALIASTSNRAKRNLHQEIEKVTGLLQSYQETRSSDSRITALETHLASLKSKLVECLINNDDDVRANLQTEIKETITKIEEGQESLCRANGLVSSSNKICETIDAFFGAISTIPADSTYSPLVAACIGEYLVGDKIKYLLKVKLVSSGADYIIEKPNVIDWYPDVFYIGGGVVTYVLTEKDGHIVASGTIADVAAIVHKIGREPTSLKWDIHPQNNAAN